MNMLFLMSVVVLDYQFLQSKNTELAKELAECRQYYRNVVSERDELQQELFDLRAQCLVIIIFLLSVIPHILCCL